MLLGDVHPRVEHRTVNIGHFDHRMLVGIKGDGFVWQGRSFGR